MPSRNQLRTLTFVIGLALTLFCAAPRALAQDEEDFGDDAPDPVRLLRRAQQAHAKGVEQKSKEELQAALELYDQAIKLNPDFAEAEYQRAVALASLGRTPEAEKGFRRAMELSPDWTLPPAALGELLARSAGREREAEEMLRRALDNNPRDTATLLTLAELRRRSGDSVEALELFKSATEDESASAATWAARGELELAADDRESALKSFSRALRLDAAHTLARVRRAEIYVDSKSFDRALKDLQALEEAARTDVTLALSVASLYARSEDKASARRVLNSLPAAARRSPEAERVLAALDDVECEDTPEAREKLERLLLTQPENAPLLACLGGLYRTSEPQRSLAYYKRASEIAPSNAKYATGYAAALVQLRKFAEAAAILKRVVQAAPDDYVARANYATALYELKLYKESVAEYNWMSKARPELAVIHFFIGTAHDRLGEYEDALRAYETFLSRADAQTNQLEIDKVNLRLPSLRNQVKRGEGVRKKGGR